MNKEWVEINEKLPSFNQVVDIQDDDGFIYEGMAFVGDSFDSGSIAIPVYPFFKWRSKSND